MRDFIYDIETYPNVFTFACEHADIPLRWSFEISPWRNDSESLVEFLFALRDNGARMVGFNNLGFDYPVVHMLMLARKLTPTQLYDKAQAIIQSQDNDKWTHLVKPQDRLIEQLDLFKIHHFDNKARSTSLKALEFAMGADNISDLPFPVGTVLTKDQVPVLHKYNQHDVAQTKQFYGHTREMIRFREELTAKYHRDYMNHNDTKIGKDFFVQELEKAGIECYGYDGPIQTKREQIALRDAILPWIEFSEPEFNRVMEWLKTQTITETKGVFNDLVARVRGFDFVFGLGGIHGSVECEVVESDDRHCIVDLDVSSYYPNLAISNRLYPLHLTERFCDVYRTLYEQRKKYKKGTAENAMLKLALNGVYGDSNNQYSPFYDPLFTMSITLNGQLLLCMLAEQVMQIEGARLLQINTDGLTVHLPREQLNNLDSVASRWEARTRLQLEHAQYQIMAIRDVNNYLAKDINGKVKRKGAYEYVQEWYKDASSLVVPKVTEQVLLNNKPIRETVENWPEQRDFMIRVKVPRNSYLQWGEGPVQNTTRYYIAKDGKPLTKWMPPLKGKHEWRKIGIESGWNVQVCNDIKDATLPIDYDYYIKEVEKLVLKMN